MARCPAPTPRFPRPRLQSVEGAPPFSYHPVTMSRGVPSVPPRQSDQAESGRTEHTFLPSRLLTAAERGLCDERSGSWIVRGVNGSGKPPLHRPCGFSSTAPVEGYGSLLAATRELSFMLSEQWDTPSPRTFRRLSSDQAERRRGECAAPSPLPSRRPVSRSRTFNDCGSTTGSPSGRSGWIR